MERMENPVQAYAWGSKTAIAGLQGRPPADKPEAELWMGAHPAAPSHVGGRPLSEVIAADPEGTLGPEVLKRFGRSLPFLFKVLAAETPLSLQAHPSLAQAKEGYEREERLGIPRGAPERNYKDPNHKPELLCALTPFDALCGFRSAADTVRLLRSLKVPELDVVLGPLAAGDSGLKASFGALMTLTDDRRRPLVDRVVAACRDAHDGEFVKEKAWAARLGELYPQDAGVVGALMLNLVHLEPDEAIYLPAGNLHAYLQGTGVELMASSDNVLRGGCTPKHVDVPELLRVLDFRAGPVAPIRPTAVSDVDEAWETPAPDFALSRLRPGSSPVTVPVTGPEIWLCTRGQAALAARGDTLALPPGASAFLAARDGEVEARDPCDLFRATVGHQGRASRLAAPASGQAF